MKILGLILLFTNYVYATDASQSSKNLEFEGEVLEGMNKAPVDSMENVARNDKVKKNHLYKKRTSYLKEMKTVAKEIGSSQ